jgi:hypothetical protein
MHGIDILPITHPNGYRQVMFMDYKNMYGEGHSALFLHTSPHKQYYLFIAPNLEAWLREHKENLEFKRFNIQNGNISYFMNMQKTHSPEFKNGSYYIDQGIAISAQGKFEML